MPPGPISRKAMARSAAIRLYIWLMATAPAESQGTDMNPAKALDLEAWEDEGGATLGVRAVSLTGTANQVEWAGRIKQQVNDEFDRVARSFRAVAAKQSDQARAD